MYINYLILKFVITDQSNNELNSREIITKELENYKDYKNNDINNINFTKHILFTYNCYNHIDIDIQNKLECNKCVEIYDQYKMYKLSESKLNNSKIKTSEILVDYSINTKDTYYIDTFSKEKIDTSQLEIIFGKPQEIVHQKCRYEYKLKFKDGKKSYIVSLYDWINEKDIFDEYEKIEWHIASETDNKNVINNFKNTLIKKIKRSDHNDNDDCC
jgi:hypothetical protein